MGEANAILINARLDAGNAADLVITLREVGDGVAPGEFFSYTIPASSFTTGSFSTVSISPTSFGFNGDETNALLDETLFEVGIQSPFGQNNQQNITVRSISIETDAAVIPEPSSLALLLSSFSLLATRRKRS